MEHPYGVTWEISSYSMQSPVRKCVRIGTPENSPTRYLGDSMNPGAGAFRFPAGELAALVRTATT